MIKAVLFEYNTSIFDKNIEDIPNLTIKAFKALKKENIKIGVYFSSIEKKAFFEKAKEYIDYVYDSKDNLIEHFISDTNVNKEEIIIYGPNSLSSLNPNSFVEVNDKGVLINNKYRTLLDGAIQESLINQSIIKREEYKPKIFFFDIDSTTFDHSIQDVRESTYLALNKLKQKGYKICINTSRSKEEMYNVPKKLLDMMDCIILLSGAHIIKDGKDIFKLMDKQEAVTLMKFMDNNDITYRYVTEKDEGFINRHDDSKESIFKKLYDMIPPIKKYEESDLLQILFYATGETRETIKNMCKASEFSYLRIGGEIYPSKADKGSSVKRVAELYGYKLEDTCAFGDGDNDSTMLEAAHLGIAMGNGVVRCKQSADYVTDDIVDEGLYNALIKLNILD